MQNLHIRFRNYSYQIIALIESLEDLLERNLILHIGGCLRYFLGDTRTRL